MGSGPPGHRLSESIPWNRFLGSMRVSKIPPLFVLLRSSSFFFASIFRICGINRLRFASICPICGINRLRSASIIRICGINRIRFALIFLRCRISRVRFASIFTSSGISRFVSLRYRKRSQDRSFVPPSFRYRCHYYTGPRSLYCV